MKYLRCKTASTWWMRVLTISPVSTSHTRTVPSLDPEIITFVKICFNYFSKESKLLIPKICFVISVLEV